MADRLNDNMWWIIMLFMFFVPVGVLVGIDQMIGIPDNLKGIVGPLVFGVLVFPLFVIWYKRDSQVRECWHTVLEMIGVRKCNCEDSQDKRMD
jgi:hypothetical protein